MKILLIENGFSDLVKSRFPLGKYFQLSGNEVFYACPDPRDIEVYKIPMNRNTLAPFELMKGCLILSDLEVVLSIDTVLSFRLIPNVLNFLASFRNKEIKRVAVITGLGYAFSFTSTSFVSVIRRSLIRLFYRLASRRIQIIVQNIDDLFELKLSNGKVVLGSGIKSRFPISSNEFPLDRIRLLYVGRLLKSKGIQTVIDVFNDLKIKSPSVLLTIAGTIDEHNPDSLTQTEIDRFTSLDGVNYLGYVNDLDSVYKECNVLLFPSVYREGIPRVILEALSQGLTIVTFDMPGCKETVQGNGLLVTNYFSAKEAVDYLGRITATQLLENQRCSIELFNEKFSDEVIYPQYLSLLK
jgi:glycosyltransferase involved in cell wall biosynthesis